VNEYEIKIDEQVNKFLDLNHKLTFFLVTGAIGTLGFTLAFAKEHSGDSTASSWLVFVYRVRTAACARLGVRVSLN